MLVTWSIRLAVVVFTLAFPNTASYGQETGNTTAKALKIAVIDMKRVRQQSTAMISIREQIGTYRTNFQAEVQSEEEALRVANQELARQRSILSAEAFAEERRKFEERLSSVQRNVQKRRQDLELAREQATTEVQNHLNEIVAALAEERRIGLVLPRAQTVLAIRSLEITDDVISRLNESLPSVNVQSPDR